MGAEILDKTHRSKKRNGESWQLLLRLRLEGAGGGQQRRSGESLPGHC